MNRFERPQITNPTSKQALTMMLRQRHPSSFPNSGNNAQQGAMGGLPFNRTGDNPTQAALARQQMMRQAALRNMNPAQMAAAAAAAAASGSNAPNANMPNAMGMSGGSMVQRQAAQQQANQLNANMSQPTTNQAGLMTGKQSFLPIFDCR